MEFEIVEVESAHGATDDVASEPEEFAFPLFGDSAADNVVTVSIKPEEDEVVVNERPELYYRAIYSEEEHRQFRDAAISADDVFAELALPVVDAWPWKVMSLEVHNAKVAHEKLRHRRRRPGMKKRFNAIACRERRSEREKEVRKEQREARSKMKRKMYKKAPRKASVVVSKPKYRTE